MQGTPQNPNTSMVDRLSMGNSFHPSLEGLPTCVWRKRGVGVGVELNK
jgi:hypothetical protein